jgi:hypothetical protein
MRGLRFVLLLLLLGTTVMGQGLADMYRSGTVNLRPSADYGAGTKWDEIFADGGANLGKAVAGRCSDIAIAEDGSVFITNREGSIVKLDNRGRLVKTFGGRGSSDGEFRVQPRIEGILDNRYVVVSEHNGRISLFNLDGQFDRVVTIDYMPLGCVPLKDGRIAIFGHVPYDGRVRLIVAIKDIESNDESIVASRFESYETQNAKVGDDSVLISISVASPYTSLVACIARTPAGNLVVGWSDSPDVEVFTPEGTPVSSFRLQTKRVPITAEDKAELTRSAKMAVDSAGASMGKKIIFADIKAPTKMPDSLPYFHKLMVDPENNLLAFTYSKKDGPAVPIEVYNLSANGQYISTAKLESADYDIGTCLRGQSLVFCKGKLYGIATPKSPTQNSPRVAEFTLSK